MRYVQSALLGQALRKLAATLPAASTNVVIVTHKPNIMDVSFPKIISARNDDVIRTEPVWRRRSRIARRLALAARPCPTPDACASHYNRQSTRSAPAANAVRQRSGRDPSSRAEASRSGVQHRGSARATSVRSGDPVSP
jgi:hypothetical protein